MTTEAFEKAEEVGGVGGDEFSVEFWTSLVSVPASFVNLVGDGEGGLDFNLMVYAGAGGFIRPHLYTTEGYTSIDSVRQLAVGEVVHVVSTWDGADLRLYLDGEEAETNLSAGSNPNFGVAVNTDNPIYIGKDDREPSPDAWIDEVAIYNHALEPARIAAHYSAGQGASPPVVPDVQVYPDPGDIEGLPAGLVTYIDFDEGAGPNAAGGVDFAYDRQGENNGRFNGTTTRTDGLVGEGAAAFDGATGAGVNLGASDDFSVNTGITVEALHHQLGRDHAVRVFPQGGRQQSYPAVVPAVRLYQLGYHDRRTGRRGHLVRIEYRRIRGAGHCV